MTVQIINLDVKISWDVPNANYADITKYKVTIVQKDGVTYTE